MIKYCERLRFIYLQFIFFPNIECVAETDDKYDTTSQYTYNHVSNTNIKCLCNSAYKQRSDQRTNKTDTRQDSERNADGRL